MRDYVPRDKVVLLSATTDPLAKDWTRSISELLPVQKPSTRLVRSKEVFQLCHTIPVSGSRTVVYLSRLPRLL